MKVMLTGAGGYLGREVLVQLVKGGHEVWCTARSTSMAHGAPHAGLLVHDWTMPLAIPRTDFDLVVHAAGANDIVSSKPGDALASTVLTAKWAAEFAGRQRQPRLLYVSTFQVYGVDEGIVDESTPCRPVNDYAFTHHMAEQWIEAVSRRTGLRYVHARPANIAGLPSVGTMNRWTLVPGCFCLDAAKNGKVIVRSTGKQQRDFLSVSEVACRIANVGSTFDHYANGCVNICSGVATTVGDVARWVCSSASSLFQRPCDLDFAPPPMVAAPHEPSALSVSSRYFEHHAHARMSPEQSRVMMMSCIDQTLQYLKETT